MLLPAYGEVHIERLVGLSTRHLQVTLCDSIYLRDTQHVSRHFSLSSDRMIIVWQTAGQLFRCYWYETIDTRQCAFCLKVFWGGPPNLLQHYICAAPPCTTSRCCYLQEVRQYDASVGRLIHTMWYSLGGCISMLCAWYVDYLRRQLCYLACIR